MIDRRGILVGAGALLASASLMTASADEASLFPVVETADGKVLYDESFAPAGLRRDGAASGYHRLAIPAGEHALRVQFNDDVRVPGFNFEREQNIVAVPGQVVLIDFNAERGGIVIQ